MSGKTFSGWVAIFSETEDGPIWYVARKSYWEKKSNVPESHCADIDIPGFEEVIEHGFECNSAMEVSDQEQTLRDLGFEIITNPVWWYDLPKSTKSDDPDFSGWIAMYKHKQWLVAPSEFWKDEECIPDYRMEDGVPGFAEVMEHCLECSDENLDYEGQKKALQDLGFEILAS